MVARLKGHIERISLPGLASELVQSLHLGMGPSCLSVEARCNDLTLSDNHRSYGRVRRSFPQALSGKAKSRFHELLVPVLQGLTGHPILSRPGRQAAGTVFLVPSFSFRALRIPSSSDMNSLMSLNCL